jgi:hypothetical protein
MEKNNSKGSRAIRAGQLAAGARRRFPNGSQSLTFGGGAVTVTVDALVAKLTRLGDLRAATTAARAAARDKVLAEKTETPDLVAFMNAFEAFVRLMFGADTPALADFGLTPFKARATRTSEDLAVAAAKRKATRAARGTKGPKARRAIRGNVTATLVVTPATPPAPADPTSAPAAGSPAPSGAAAASTQKA